MPGPPPASSTSNVVVVLREAGCVFAEDEARLLIDAAATPTELARLVSQRVAGIPLEQVLGWAAFCGLRIAMEPGVFVPRRRTELLVREAVTALRPGAVVVDLCCGSGAVGAAITAGVADIRLAAADIDPAAVRCARKNLSPPAEVFVGDLYDGLPRGLRGQVDVITANAPYVPSDAIALMPPEARIFEPRPALDGGPDGVELHRRLAAAASRWLAPGGLLLIETSVEQADLTALAVTESALVPTITHDDDLDATVVSGLLSP
jgi:release factor glutamine methyltransferase